MKILYAHTSNSDYVRVKKNLGYFDTLNCDIIFFGAFRHGQKKDSGKNIYKNVKILYYSKVLKHGLVSVFSFLGYIFNLNKLIRNEKPEIILLTNEELYLSLFLINKKKTKVIIDAIDALDIRVESSAFIKKILNYIVRYIRGKSDVVVEVESFRSERFPQFTNKTVVIRNTPNIFRMNKAPVNYTDYKDYIYASGSLNENINGIETLIDALDLFNRNSERKIKVLIAGIIIGDSLTKKINNNKFVNFIGSVSLEESHYLASNSLAMFAFYKPDRLNFIYAAPNKVYESFMLGKPLLINEECIISKLCSEKKNGFLSSYNDVIKLSKNISDIVYFPNIFLENLKNDFQVNMSWGLEQKKWDILFFN